MSETASEHGSYMILTSRSVEFLAQNLPAGWDGRARERSASGGNATMTASASLRSWVVARRCMRPGVYKVTGTGLRHPATEQPPKAHAQSLANGLIAAQKKTCHGRPRRRRERPNF